MKEQVIFPEPQDVTILATRNGELTQIPGLEFRAPIVPYETEIKAWWNTGGRTFVLMHSREVIIDPIALYQPDPWGGFNVYGMPGDETYRIPGKTYVKWKKHPDNYKGTPSADPSIKMIIYAEVRGYKTTEKINIEDSNSTTRIYLPDSVGVMADIVTYNPQWSEDKWGW